MLKVYFCFSTPPPFTTKRLINTANLPHLMYGQVLILIFQQRVILMLENELVKPGKVKVIKDVRKVREGRF